MEKKTATKQESFGKGKEKPAEQPAEQPEGQQNDNWEVVGWLNKNKSGKTFSVSDADGNLVGFLRTSSMDKMMAGDISGVPIKRPKDDG